MKNYQTLRLLTLASFAFFVSCSNVPSTNVLDPASKNYVGDAAAADSDGNGIANYYESSKVSSSSASSSSVANSSVVNSSSSQINTSSSSSATSSSIQANPSAEYVSIASLGLWVGRTEVANWLYAKVTGVAQATDSLLPVSSISWREALKFCNALSQDSGLAMVYSFKPDSSVVIDTAATGYRLPSVLEWESIANNSVTTNTYIWGSAYSIDNANATSWHLNNSGFAKHDVALKTASTMGFYDLMGNVAEMTQDTSAGYVVVMGGSYATDPTSLKISASSKQTVTANSALVGFRLVRKIVK